ncbi:MCE family protein [Nocardia farcinica]|uniref:MCE family protein n=3 Tax=Nocardia TaxID=1817 RepID=UPI0024563E57|nr:MCE family protein [Nocardia farcinica]
MTQRRTLIGLVLFLVVSFVLSWLVFVTLQRGVEGSTRSYTATFTDVSGLRTGDDVRVAGVRVGRVDRIELDGHLAAVTFRVQDDQTLYTTTRAAVTYQNIIGQRYLALSEGAFDVPVEKLPDGGRIPVEHTEPSFDIAAMLRGFEPLFTVLDPDQVDKITETLILALQGDTGSLATLIAQTSALAQSFAGPDRVLDEVIVNLDAVLRSLAAQSGNLESVMATTEEIFTALAAERDRLTGQIDAISTTVGSMSEVFTGIDPSMRALLAREPGFTGHITGNAERFAYLFYNIPVTLKGFARFTQDGASANAYICNLNITLIPGLSHLIPDVVAGLSPDGKIQQSAKCR